MKGQLLTLLCAISCAVHVFAAPNYIEDVDDLFDARQLFTAPLPNINLTEVIDRYACFVKAAESVTIEAGMADVWAEYGDRFADNIAKWEKCGTNLLIPTHLMCHATQGGTAYNLVIEYLQTVMAKDPNFTTTLFTEFSKQCTIVPPAQVIYSLSNVRLFRQQYDRQSAVDYVKCVISAITNGVDESDYAYLWNTYLTKIEKSLQNVVRCKNQGSPIDAAKCVLTELQGIADMTTEFFKKVNSENQALVKRIKEDIKNNCINPNNISFELN